MADLVFFKFRKTCQAEKSLLKIIQLPTAKERAKIFGQYDHVRVYGRDYFDKLRSIGFKVDEVDFTKKIDLEKLERFALMKGEILPVCFKD